MTYAEVRRETANRMQTTDRLTCGWCGRDTQRETLATYGARCRPCFDAYCAEKPPRVEQPPAGVVPPGPRAWAYRLQWRHQQGERLTPAQVSMYRECLRNELTPVEAMP